MIKYKDTILENFFIDPVTAVITNSKGEVQKTYIHGGRLEFKKMSIHAIQAHTHYGYKKGFDIHHIDENKFNNALSNLIYLTRSEHSKIHANGNKNMFGKHHSEETKRKIAESHKGRTLSEDTKRKISESHKGKKLSDETKKKLSESISGENHPLYGKHHSEETKQKMSAAKKGRHFSDEHKEKLSNSHKGKTSNVKDRIWVNNGVIAKRVKCDEIPTGFIRGRLKKISEDENDEKELLSVIEEECEKIIKENKIGVN